MTSAARLVSVVIPVLDAGPSLASCLSPLVGQDDVEMILVDNASSDGSVDRADRDHPDISVLRNDRNTGFAAASNQGAAVARGRYLLFLNSDARIDADELRRLVGSAEDDPGAAAWQPVIVNRDGVVENAGERFTWSGFIIRSRVVPSATTPPFPVFSATAACLLVRRSAFEDVGGFRDDYFAYHEDVDLTWRLRLSGWMVRLVPGVTVLHEKHATSRRILEPHDARYLTFRNRLRTILADTAPATLVRVLPLHVLLCMAGAVAMLLSGRGRSSAAIIRALSWPVAHRRRMAEQRRHAQSLRRVADAVLLSPDVRAPLLSRQGWQLATEHLRGWERVRAGGAPGDRSAG